MKKVSKVNKENLKMMKEELIRETNRKEQVKKDMLENTSYIDWLVHFTEEYPIFSDDDWLYNVEGITEDDLEKVKNLPLLFECISSFAEKNYLTSTLEEWGEYYSIRKDDTYLNIGYNAGQGTSFYCERTDKNANSISYYNIMNQEPMMRTMYVNHKLAKISDEIKDLLVNLKVPVEYIEEMVDNTNKETVKEKVYIKK